MIPPAFVHELLSRVDIVEIVGRSVELKRAGATWKGLCPFHGEKSPSFTVSPSRQTYHCFGCGVHGNAVGFLIEQHGMGFVDAVRDLAQHAGLAVPKTASAPGERDEAARQKQKQLTLSDVLARAAAGYRRQLKASERAVAYLKGRGLSGEIAARFGLGYATDSWRGLASVFPNYDDPSLEESGLVIAQGDEGGRNESDGPPSGKRYDRFRDRIMFPIRSVQGSVIGFGGRVLDRGEPKYLNSPETPVFSKGRELYGLFEARTAIRQRGYALVVEGYMDVVALAQAGFENAVATLGTAAPPSTSRSWCASRTRSSSASTATPPAGGLRARPRSQPAARERHAQLPLPVPACPSTTRTASCARPGRTPSRPPSPLPCAVAAAGRPGRRGCRPGRRRARALPGHGRGRSGPPCPTACSSASCSGEIASRAALSTESWRAPGEPEALARAGRRLRRTRRRRRADPAAGGDRSCAKPADRRAWLLLLESRWWDS
jgi:DNA primase